MALEWHDGLDAENEPAPQTQHRSGFAAMRPARFERATSASAGPASANDARRVQEPDDAQTRMATSDQRDNHRHRPTPRDIDDGTLVA